MKFGRVTSLLLATICVVVMSAAGWAQEPCGVPNEIYCQGQDNTGVAYSSQNDTTSGFGNFATAYEDFTLSQASTIQSYHWVGLYFNPGPPGNITGWTISFYNDVAGTPDYLNPFSTQSFAGSLETAIGFTGDLFQYDATLNIPQSLGAGTYWVSVVPDQGFPPQWGWATSGTGNTNAFQCFFGACATIDNGFGGGVNLAFAVDGVAQTTVPEPGSLALLGTGILGLAGVIRRKLF